MNETEKICGICLLPIINGRSNQLYHAGECARIAHNKRCIERSRKKWLAVSPLIDKLCPVCNQPYQTRAARAASTCRNPDCKNKIQRERMKEEWHKKTEEERREINKKRYERYASQDRERSLKNYYTDKNPTQTLDCICPGCGIHHNHTFSPKWIGIGTPRKGCERYPSCANGPAFRDGRTTEQIYSTAYESAWECSNSGRV